MIITDKSSVEHTIFPKIDKTKGIALLYDSYAFLMT